MAQLYLGGYKNMYTHFLYYNEQEKMHTLVKHWLLEHVPFLEHKTFDEVNDAIVHGVLQAYDDQKLPYTYSVLNGCTAHEVGYLLSSLMCETMYLGHLLNVDPFDQPSVELYKKHTRSILSL
jgi:glucose-6-phosphate isomerase